jgi:hypothetical protein
MKQEYHGEKTIAVAAGRDFTSSPSISCRELFYKFDTVDQESLVVPSESLLPPDEGSDKARVKRALATDLLPEAGCTRTGQAVVLRRIASG